MNTKVDKILNSAQETTQWTDLPYSYQLDLLSCKFLRNHSETQHYDNVKDSVEEEGKYIVEYVNNGK